MSESHFVRRFHEEYSETPYAYLMTRRIERAMALLSHTDLTITDIAFTVGWASLGSFSTRFHELVGFSPSTYRTVHGKTSSRLSVCQTMAAARPGRHIRRDS